MSIKTPEFFQPIQSYDFHIYYYSNYAPSRQEAIQFKNKIFENFQKEIDDDILIVKVQRNERISGPHIVSFFEVDIEDPSLFIKFFSFSQLHHGNLNILVHPNSGDPFKDHIDFPAWIGNKLPLISKPLTYAKGYPEFGFPNRELIKDGFYDIEERWKKSIMVRLLNKAPENDLWSDESYRIAK
ncbi:hypothetical protein WICMUC_003879 [Wickerhamomyces mucosus]|uniref:DOPA 4,5-dioxygenase n=1 Tax=Wickerhamomyces mucosus TaxID=1378264 RepID=A0A9P8PIW4_9ASCO|nr:hypothetical protein WICMUC_003879 [Wickerhamomyces mucosus]